MDAGGTPANILAVERFDEILDEIKPLLEEHWEELARNKDLIRLDPDYDMYRAIDKAGKLRIFTLRRYGELMAYAVYIVNNHLHYKTKIWAVSDIFWTSPEIRRSGAAIISLLRFAERQLEQQGVDVVHTTHKDAHPGPGRVLEHLGHTLIEHGYAKLLRGTI